MVGFGVLEHAVRANRAAVIKTCAGRGMKVINDSPDGNKQATLPRLEIDCDDTARLKHCSNEMRKMKLPSIAAYGELHDA